MDGDFFVFDGKENAQEQSTTNDDLMESLLNQVSMKEDHYAFDFDLPDTPSRKRKISEVEGEISSQEMKSYSVSSTKRIRLNDHISEKEKDGEETVVSGFSVAGSKRKISVKRSSLQSSKIFEENIEEFKTPDQKKKKKKKKKKKSSDVVFSGFSTGSNKKISIKRKSLSKGKALFNEENSFKTPNTKKKDSNDSSSSIISGFSNAKSNKKISIKKKVLEKGKTLFQTPDSKSDDSFVSGFSTGNKKKINIKKKSLIKGNKLFEDLPQTPETVVSGFSVRGSNRKISIKRKSLQKGKIVFEENGNSSKKEEPEKSVVSGFSIGGSNRKVSFKRKSLQKGKELFDKENEETFKTPKNTSIVSGFSTGSKKKISISKKSLMKGKTLFDTPKEKKKQEEVVVSGFSAGGSNKKINIKRKSLDNGINVLNSNKKENEEEKKTKNKDTFTFGNIGRRNSLQKQTMINELNKQEKKRKKKKKKKKIVSRSSGKFKGMLMKRKRERFKPPRSIKKKKTKKKIAEKVKLVVPDFFRVKKIGKNIERKNAISLEDLDTKENEISKSRASTKTIHSIIINMTSKNAESFRFDRTEFPMGKEMEDLMISKGIITNTYKEVGWVEFLVLLLQLGANKKAVNDEWVRNHYRWIVWKIACYERRFPHHFAGKLFNPKEVFERLLFRYKHEYVNGKRTCLDQIATGDVHCTSYMVLCVADLSPVIADPQFPEDSNNQQNQQNQQMIGIDSMQNETIKKIELTDGWYSIIAGLDPVLKSYVEWGKLKVGDKIRIVNGVLQNAQACPILSLPKTSFLQLFANSVRKASWDSQLGLVKQVPFRVNIKSTRIEGGIISSIEGIVCKRYPINHLEKKVVSDPQSSIVEKKSILRNKIAEDIEKNKFEFYKEKKVEEIRERINKNIEREEKEQYLEILESQKRRKRKLKFLDLEDLCVLKKYSNDPYNFMSQFRQSKQDSILRFEEQRKFTKDQHIINLINEEIEKIPELNRQVSNFFSIKLKDCCPYSKNNVWQADKMCSISVWGANDEQILSEFEEGSIVRFYGIVPSRSYNEVKSFNYAIGFGTNKFQVVKRKNEVSSDELSRLQYKGRTLSNIQNLLTHGYSGLEFDFVGYCLHVSQPIKMESNGNGSSQDYTIKRIFFADFSCELILVVQIFEYSNVLTFSVAEDRFYVLRNLSFSKVDKNHKMLYCTGSEKLEIFPKSFKERKFQESITKIKQEIPSNDLQRYKNRCQIMMNRITPRNKFNTYNPKDNNNMVSTKERHQNSEEIKERKETRVEIKKEEIKEDEDIQMKEPEPKTELIINDMKYSREDILLGKCDNMKTTFTLIHSKFKTEFSPNHRELTQFFLIKRKRRRKKKKANNNDSINLNEIPEGEISKELKAEFVLSLDSGKQMIVIYEELEFLKLLTECLPSDNSKIVDLMSPQIQESDLSVLDNSIIQKINNDTKRLERIKKMCNQNPSNLIQYILKNIVVIGSKFFQQYTNLENEKRKENPQNDKEQEPKQLNVNDVIMNEQFFENARKYTLNSISDRESEQLNYLHSLKFENVIFFHQKEYKKLLQNLFDLFVDHLFSFRISRIADQKEKQNDSNENENAKKAIVNHVSKS